MKGNTAGSTSKAELATDWDRLHSQTDEALHAALANDPDIQPTDEIFWKGARVVMLAVGLAITVTSRN